MQHAAARRFTHEPQMFRAQRPLTHCGERRQPRNALALLIDPFITRT